jgi:hypothetical protein
MIREHNSPSYYVGVGNGFKPYLITLDGDQAHIHYRVLRENGVSTAELIGPKIFFNEVNDLDWSFDGHTVPKSSCGKCQNCQCNQGVTNA